MCNVACKLLLLLLLLLMLLLHLFMLLHSCEKAGNKQTAEKCDIKATSSASHSSLGHLQCCSRMSAMPI